MTLLESLKNCENIFHYLKEHIAEDILQESASLLNIPVKEMTEFHLEGFPKEKPESTYLNSIKELIENAEEYRFISLHLQDEKSKQVFLQIIRYRLLPDIRFLDNASDPSHLAHFDPDIINCSASEVYVNYAKDYGEQIQTFLTCCPDYKKILMKNVHSLEECKENLIGADRLEYIPSGSNDTEQDKLDFCLQESISFLSVDVNCEEEEVLLGAKWHIQNDRPKLSVCLYQGNNLWKTPKLLLDMLPIYQIFLRCYSAENHFKTIIYAVPDLSLPFSKDAFLEDEKPSVYLFPLPASCGIKVPFEEAILPAYSYYQQFGRSFRIILSSLKEAKNYISLKGMELIELDNSDTQEEHAASLEYIKRYFADIDILFLVKLHPWYFSLAALYKKLRPDGKIVLKLNTSLEEISELPLYQEGYFEFISHCDIITVESSCLQKHLSKRFSACQIEYLPNGYYCFENFKREIDYTEKENILLRVEQIGTYQKNDEQLLEAFSLISSLIPNWKLKLIGRVDSEFREYLNEYFENRPDLKDRIVFCSAPISREELWNEYQRAKIFVLTSRWENGSPYSYAEAAYMGCNILVTDIDAAKDMTNQGQYGTICPHDQIKSLALAITKLCTDEFTLQKNAQLIREYAQDYFDAYKISKKLDLLLRLS